MTRRRYATPEESFLARTEPIVGDPGCLIWTGSDDGDGYGKIKVNRRDVRVHRYAWERENGPIPDGMMIDHRLHCDRSCVEVSHLRLATRTENARNRSGATRDRKHNLPRGVYRNGSGYQARIKVSGKRINCGTFPTIERAKTAIANARRFYFNEFAGR